MSLTRLLVASSIGALLSACTQAPPPDTASARARGIKDGDALAANDVNLDRTVALFQGSWVGQTHMVADGQFCSGVEICPWVVLSAGHCMADPLNGAPPASLPLRSRPLLVAKRETAIQWDGFANYKVIPHPNDANNYFDAEVIEARYINQLSYQGSQDGLLILRLNQPLSSQPPLLIDRTDWNEYDIGTLVGFGQQTAGGNSHSQGQRTKGSILFEQYPAYANNWPVMKFFEDSTAQQHGLAGDSGGGLFRDGLLAGIERGPGTRGTNVNLATDDETIAVGKAEWFNEISAAKSDWCITMPGQAGQRLETTAYVKRYFGHWFYCFDQNGSQDSPNCYQQFEAFCKAKQIKTGLIHMGKTLTVKIQSLDDPNVWTETTAACIQPWLDIDDPKTPFTQDECCCNTAADYTGLWTIDYCKAKGLYPRQGTCNSGLPIVPPGGSPLSDRISTACSNAHCDLGGCEPTPEPSPEPIP